NAGTIRLSGTLETNLVFLLSSSDPTEVLVPASVIVRAGNDLAHFDLTIVDDLVVDGLQTATVTASAAGFGIHTASIEVLDDETPPAPYQPAPANGALAVALTTDLSWRAVGEVLVNGGFETGDFTGWNQ